MDFTTQNGNVEVTINTPSFKDASNLKKTVMKCITDLKGVNGVELTNLQNIDLSNVLELIVNFIAGADSSDEFEKAVFDCLSQSTYNHKKINEQLFDDYPEAREDYYEIVAKCCEVTLRPFFKSLVSELKTRFQALTPSDPEPKS